MFREKLGIIFLKIGRGFDGRKLGFDDLGDLGI